MSRYELKRLIGNYCTISSVLIWNLDCGYIVCTYICTELKCLIRRKFLVVSVGNRDCEGLIGDEFIGLVRFDFGAILIDFWSNLLLNLSKNPSKLHQNWIAPNQWTCLWSVMHNAKSIQLWEIMSCIYFRYCFLERWFNLVSSHLVCLSMDKRSF